MGGTVIDTVDAQARSRRDAIAIEQEGVEPLTYRALVARSCAIAEALQRVGVGRDDVVALLVERSPEAIVAMLGVLRSGAAYLPLDPSYPAQRLAAMVRDSGARVVVCAANNADVAATFGVTIMTVGAGEAVASSPARIASDALAYVMFTSGSTGTPKAVMVEHHSLAHFTDVAAELFGLQPSDRVLQFASLSWDTSIEELFPCLSQGGTVVLRTRAMTDSVQEFLARCAAWRITVVDLPTAFFGELVRHLEQAHAQLPACLRLVIVGGERVPVRYVARWHDVTDGRAMLLNTYGITEATAISTACVLGADRNWTEATAVPIGAAIRGVEVHVLDADMQPVGAGEIGELYIGGAGVARGYLGRPELTAERFLTDASRGRLYRSGDLVRIGHGGYLESMGRADEQVKIRGHRVELAEVETALLALHQVAAACVVAPTNPAGDPMLTAYVVAREPAADSEPLCEQVRALLTASLPAHLVPALFVALPALPLGPNGKVDRNALPAPWHAAPAALPNTAVERVLCRIWSQVLGIEVGVEDHFLEVGGASLQAIQIVTRIREVFAVEVPLHELFTVGDVRGLARSLLGDGAKSAELERVALQISAQ